MIRIVRNLIAGIIQARMTSTRLPGKVMLEVYRKPLLQHMVERVKRSKRLDRIVIATTNNEKDNTIVDFCKTNNIEYYRGPEQDVLLRYKLASDAIEADTVVRLSSDCPLIDPFVIDKAIDIFLNSEYDFVNTLYPLPRTYPDGMSVEVFSSHILGEANKEAKKPSEREHVTFFVWMQPTRYKIFRLDYEKDLSKYRLNLDYPEDYALIKIVFEQLYPKKSNFTMENTINLLNSHPDVLKLNAHIKPNQGWIKSFEADKKQVSHN